MNYYAIMMFFLYSPWGWLILGVLIAIFVVASMKLEMATSIEQAFAIDPDDPAPELTREHLHSIKSFWFGIRMAAIIALISITVIPFFFTYSGWVSH